VSNLIAANSLRVAKRQTASLGGNGWPHFGDEAASRSQAQKRTTDPAAAQGRTKFNRVNGQKESQKASIKKEA